MESCVANRGFAVYVCLWRFSHSDGSQFSQFHAMPDTIKVLLNWCPSILKLDCGGFSEFEFRQCHLRVQFSQQFFVAFSNFVATGPEFHLVRSSNPCQLLFNSTRLQIEFHKFLLPLGQASHERSLK
jgi:hypothetical protein